MAITSAPESPCRRWGKRHGDTSAVRNTVEPTPYFFAEGSAVNVTGRRSYELPAGSI